MTFDESTPILELPGNQTWYRIQLIRPHPESVCPNGFVLRPAQGVAARFDVAGVAIAYLADAPETALYESVFRREVRSCSMERLRRRALATFLVRERMRVADLRSLAEPFPVLLSQRYESTQAFAQSCEERGLHGVLYSSAQHPGHSCLAMFPAGIALARRVGTQALVKPRTSQLLRPVMTALRGSMVPLVDE